jgi:hypothetical protein
VRTGANLPCGVDYANCIWLSPGCKKDSQFVDLPENLCKLVLHFSVYLLQDKDSSNSSYHLLRVGYLPGTLYTITLILRALQKSS